MFIAGTDMLQNDTKSAFFLSFLFKIISQVNSPSLKYFKKNVCREENCIISLFLVTKSVVQDASRKNKENFA